MEQNDEWAAQRARYLTLETIPPISDNPIVILPAVTGAWGITVTVLDCTPQVRHDNLGDSAVATTGYLTLFCANAVSNSSGD